MIETPKIRRVDYHPDAMIAGVTREMSMFDFGVYWWICTLIYSRGGAIPDDHTKLAGMFINTHWREVRASIDRLVTSKKVVQEGGKLYVMACAREMQAASNRIAKASHNGVKGGRPSNENKELGKAPGFSNEKLIINNQLPITIDQEGVTPLKPLSPTKRRRCDQDADPDFSEWWTKYPRKVAKKDAVTAYLKARKLISAEQLSQGLDRYIAECVGKNPDYIKYPATWLTKQCWLDEPTPTLALIDHGEPNGKAAQPVPAGPLDRTRTEDRPISPLYAALEDAVG